MDENRRPGSVRLCDSSHFNERAARDELERLIGDSRLHLTDRNRAFLRYIAEETFSGNAKGAKAYAIAVDVFGRPSNFDPATDPIVRIEAARLRAALDQFYEAYGAAGQIRISLPRGHYVAEFSQVVGNSIDQPITLRSASGSAIGSIPEVPQSRQNVDLRWWSRWKTAVSTCAGVLAVVSGAVAYYAFSGVPGAEEAIEKPLVSFIVTTRDPANDDRAENIEDDLVVALARFGTLRLANRQTFAMNQPVATLTGVYRDTKLDPSDYQIALKYKVDDVSRRVAWTVIEPGTGETLASGEETVPNESGQADEADAQLVTKLAARFGSGLGLLAGIELHSAGTENAIGNTCVLKGEYAISRGTVAELGHALECLKETLNVNPRDSDANATLARVMVALDETSGTMVNSAAALRFADQAIAMAPNSDRALAARMVTLYANGRMAAAETAGSQVLEANPLNAEAASAFALRLYVTGSWAKGVGLAQRTLANFEVASSDASMVLALENYRSGAVKAALRQLDATVGESCIGSAVRIASLIRLGRRQEAVSMLDQIQQRHPSFQQKISKILDVRHFDASLADMLKRDIAAAGAQT